MKRLARFIRTHRNALVSECEARAGNVTGGVLAPAAGAHMKDVLDRLTERLDASDRARDALTDLAMQHAARCYRDGIALAKVVGGYSSFRHVVLATYAGAEVPKLRDRLAAMGFLNDCIDVAISEAVEQFARETAHDRDLLIATVNHDLGNEVGVVRMTAASLLEDRDLPSRVRERALVISDSARLMARMVSDISGFTEVQFGGRLSIEPKPCDACSICRRVVQGMLAAAPGRQVSVRCSGCASGNWDADRLAELVRNLVANAIQHGDGPVVVAVGPIDDGSGVSLAVSNHGPVIPDEVLPTLFAPRQRKPPARSTEPAPRRTGLGLYMVKTIAEAHGGSVAVESRRDKGTVFTVQLPVDAEARARPQEHENQRSERARRVRSNRTSSTTRA
jgi:signal transduction histidine kinase